VKRYDEDGKEITSLKVHGKKIRKPYTLKSTIAGYLCISAFLILYLVFTIWPLIDGFLISFTEWNILGPRVFVGLSNYIEMLQSELFWSSLWHTTIFVLLSVPAIMIGGFLLALLVDHKNLKCNTFFRVTFFSPQVLSVAIVSYIWVVVLEPYTGLLNNFLGTVGIMGDEIFWLRDRSLVWFSLVMITFWWTVGFNMILYLAAMQDIPDSYYESAEIDGASYFSTLVKIYIPCSMAAIATISLFCMVHHWNAWFDGLIYMTSANMRPLQTYLRMVVIQLDLSTATMNEVELLRVLSDRGLRAAQVIIAIIPVLAVYPFLQKYFVKGIVLGSVKG